VYGWIWRRLPGGRLARVLTALILIGGAAALLWFVAFPLVDQYLPNTAAQVTGG